MKGETPAVLEGRKRELYDAIRTLDRDRRDGLIDAEAYRDARARYELEAAGILERLDLLERTVPAADDAPIVEARRRLPIIGAGAVVILAIALFLGGALHARTGTAAITGDIGQATPAPAVGQSPQVLQAQARVSSHPRD